MGRTYDGGYAEYTSVPLSQVIPVDTELPWEVLGALPEMVQTAYGSLTIGLDLKPGQSALIRGGTSSVGLAAAALAAWRGATVLSTTRQADRLALLKEHGVDHPLLDAGEVAPAVRALYPDGMPGSELIDRGFAIADHIMSQPRTIRRLTTQIVRRPWKRRVMEDLDGGFGIQMFGHVASRHAVHGGEHVRSTVDYVREGRKNDFDDPEKHAE